MKKYSADYFREKFHTLYTRLLEKEGFSDVVFETRKNLGIPEKGFNNSLELAQYFMERLSKKEKEVLTSVSFLEQYEMQNGRVPEAEMKKVEKDFNKKFKNDFVPILILTAIQMRLEGHNDFFTSNFFISYGKKNANLFELTKKVFDKFMDVDLLDPHLIMHFVERYIFLGEQGVRDYIKEKIDCPFCRYIGVSHFSAERHNMDGQDEGPFSNKYVFNKKTVKLLSAYFDSLFLIIKPYASKDQVIQYVNDNWEELKEHLIAKNTFYRQLEVSPARIKKSAGDRNRLIYELQKSSKKDLVARYKGDRDFSVTGIYKEDIVSAILKEEYGLSVSSDAVKKTASRFAKSKKLKRQPKDIRDI